MTKIESGVHHDWQDTLLWKCLLESKKPEVGEIRNTLETWMPKIQTILAQGGTTPTDFTLHDAQHAFRVAERMVELIPTDVLSELSTYELALLLLAAYLHDIGMTPTQGPINQLHEYLLTGMAERLPQSQIDSFQRWLDDQEDEIVIPLTTGTPTSTVLRRARNLIAQYCRASHIDWSEQWIGNYLAQEKLGTYAHWISDLKALCRSHREGYKELLGERFEPKAVGSASMVVHLRYIAVVLRVADILEFDPERTPEILFEHRDIDPTSVIYWYKDHYVTHRFENGRLTIIAEPPDARLHRAIEIMADDIESELRLARRLDDEKPFETARFQERCLPHRWTIRPDVRRDIRPLNNAYEYIDGAFRPDTRKLLQLLSGKELYGDELIAIRELLQNAFDAVREQIAYERLEKQNPADPKWEETLGSIHQVELSIEIEDDRVWLICTDDGIGMSKSIISNHLLISGNTRRRDIRFLERRCKENNFELGRTGQFGIGVLSYFMIADHVQIRTKRGSLAEDTETTGWIFEISGVGAFGELRKDPSWKQGTQVRLRLKIDVIRSLANQVANYHRKVREKASFEADEFSEIFEKMPENNNHSDSAQEPNGYSAFADLLLAYLRITLRYLPCIFQFIYRGDKNQPYAFQRGWSTDPAELSNISVKTFLDKWEQKSIFREEEFMSEQAQLQHADRRSYYINLPSRVKNCLRWETREGELPEGLGTFRIHIPIFRLRDGNSNFYLDIEVNQSETLVHRVMNDQGHDPAFTFKPEGKLYTSWRGMAVKLPPKLEESRFIRRPMEEDAIIEIDWRNANAGTLSVDREKITLSAIGINALDWVRNEVLKAYSDFIATNPASPYTTLSRLLVSDDVAIENRQYWLHTSVYNRKFAIWGPIQFPAVNLALIDTYALPEGFRLKWNREIVHQFLSITLTYSDRSRYRGFRDAPWCSAHPLSQYKPNEDISGTIRFPPDRIVTFKGQRNLEITGLWLKMPTQSSATYFGGFKTEFPAKWSDYAFVSINYESQSYHSTTKAWNQTHRLSTASAESQEWVVKTFRKKDSLNLDPRTHKGPLLQNRDKAIAWLALMLSSGDSDLWIALTEKEREFLDEMWQLIFHNNSYAVYILDADYRNSIRIYTPDSRKIIDDTPTVESLLPDPGPEWTLQVDKPKEEPDL